jgi:hypothetical protein
MPRSEQGLERVEHEIGHFLHAGGIGMIHGGSTGGGGSLDPLPPDRLAGVAAE